MRYIPSEEAKSHKIYYQGIEKSPWVLNDGTLNCLLNKHLSGGESALDIGCGNGFILGTLDREFGFSNLCGIDLVCYLEENIKPRVKFRALDINFERLPYSGESFDLVTAIQVVEHLENPFFIMREIRRVLKKGGLFIMSVPNPFQITFRTKFLLTGNLPPWTHSNDHLLFMTRDVFAKTYLSNFDLVETVYQKGAIPFWGRLRYIFGKHLIKKHAMVLPRSELFGRRVCLALRKRS